MEEQNTGEIEIREEQKSWMHDFFGFLKVVFISLLIVLPIRAFIVQPFIVRGASMEPTYQQGEYLIVDEVSYYFREPERGEVIIFRYPRNPKQFFIKRIIGLPGERVEIRDGAVTIINEEYPNGVQLDESYISEELLTGPDTISILDPEEYFVLGDNRPQSLDSRIWGALDSNYIVGRAWVRLWPLSRIGGLE